MAENYANPAGTPATSEGYELGWEDEINDDRIELKPGRYRFRLAKLTRGRHSGAQWMPACNKADLSLEVIDPESGQAVLITDTLYLHTKGKWKICKFFEAIGLKKKGENLRMQWNIVGASGWCETVLKEGNKGGKFANVKSYIPAEDIQPESQMSQPMAAQPAAYSAAQPATQTWTPAPAQPAQGAPQMPSWNPGAF